MSHEQVASSVRALPMPRVDRLRTVVLVGVLLVVALGGVQPAGAVDTVGPAAAAPEAPADPTPATGAPFAAVAGPDSATPNGTVLTVDDDGPADYSSIQAAVDDAEDGATVRVRPGTYREEVRVDANITLIAPDGATLNGSTINAGSPIIDTAITIGESANPVIEGFTITGYAVGLRATGTTADWVLRNATIRVDFIAVNAGGRATTSDWLVEDIEVRFTGEPEVGISATSSAGNWTVRDSTIVNADRAIDADSTRGDWRVEGVTIRNVLLGVDAARATGDWRIERTSIRTAVYGVGAYRSTGAWVIRNSTVANTSAGDRYTLTPPMPEGVGIYAGETSGAWTVRGTTFAANEAGGIVAPDAAPRGSAIDNRWDDRSRPTEGDCRGNVTCTVGPRTATATPASPGPTPTVTPNASTATPRDRTATATATGTALGTASPPGEPATPSAVALPFRPVLVLVALLGFGVILARGGDD